MNYVARFIPVVLTLSILSTTIARPADSFARGLFIGADTIHYRLFKPKAMKPGGKYPLIIAFHGVGEWGTDNEQQLTANRMAEVWAEDSNQARNPCFVCAPQTPVLERWVSIDWTPGVYAVSSQPVSKSLSTALKLLDSLTTAFPIDTNRLYITGISMGGCGAWDAIARFPKKFAAAVPMSGAVDTAKAALLSGIPIWSFHGGADGVIHPIGSQRIFARMEKAGIPVVFTNCKNGACAVLPGAAINSLITHGAKHLYTEYEGLGHVMWDQAYNDPHLSKWLFAQSKQTAVHPVNVDKSNINNSGK